MRIRFGYSIWQNTRNSIRYGVEVILSTLENARVNIIEITFFAIIFISWRDFTIWTIRNTYGRNVFYSMVILEWYILEIGNTKISSAFRAFDQFKKPVPHCLSFRQIKYLYLQDYKFREMKFNKKFMLKAQF